MRCQAESLSSRVLMSELEIRELVSWFIEASEERCQAECLSSVCFDERMMMPELMTCS